MHSVRKSDRKSYDLKNCFGFNENDIDLSLWDRSSVMSDTSAPIEFQPNKPYRLALYVRPNERLRLQKTNISSLVTEKEKPSTRRNILKEVNTKPVRRFKQTKLQLMKCSKKDAENIPEPFSDLVSKEMEPQKFTRSRQKAVQPPINDKKEKLKGQENISESFSNHSIKEMDITKLPRSKQNKVRRSYERKCKENRAEVIVEPPSEEIIKEIEIKKLSRTKQKKTAKEDKEFEKWANNMNSAFDDVDKFELSIAYD